MKIAVCPGSFDPITNGHLDIIKRASKLFDKVIVVVMVNSSKEPNFTTEERVDFISRAIKDINNVEVDSYNGLLADYVAEMNATAVVKGLRVMSDFEYEFQMALTNMSLSPNTETIFLPSSAEWMWISSSIVREVASRGRDISKFVPLGLADDITAKLCGKDDNNGNR